MPTLHTATITTTQLCINTQILIFVRKYRFCSACGQLNGRSSILVIVNVDEHIVYVPRWLSEQDRERRGKRILGEV